MLIHGWGASKNKLYPLKKELEKLGWKVFLPKLPGFEKPAPVKVWGIEDYSDYLYEKARKYFRDENFLVFGHSFGGGVAIKIASEKKNVMAVILCAARGIRRGKFLKRFIFNLLAKAGKIFVFIPPLAYEFRKLLYKAAGEHDYEKAQGIMKKIFKRIISEDLSPLLQLIKIPTLILWGNKDRITPIKDALLAKRLVRKCDLIIFEDQGHRLPYEKPKDLAKNIDLWYKTTV